MRCLIEPCLAQAARLSAFDRLLSIRVPDVDILLFRSVAVIDEFLSQVLQFVEARALEFCGAFLTRVW